MPMCFRGKSLFLQIKSDIFINMRRLIIRNFGPIKEANLNFGRVNLITGLQSSGKSCILKTACYCTWVEKRLQLSQNMEEFKDSTSFIDKMTDYYQIKGYVQENTYIEYETSCLKFSYDHSSQTFTKRWKKKRWEYKRPKVSYIPADRNLVASIPAWSALPVGENMLEFMSNWDKARRFVRKEENFLKLGLSYSYDNATDTDNIVLRNGKSLLLKESSSGVQSLLPMYVHLDYLVNWQYQDNNGNVSYEAKNQFDVLLTAIRNTLAHKMTKADEDLIYHNLKNINHSEIFLEEPEANLFPPTQCQFVKWLLQSIEEHKDVIFIATHSPYVLNEIIKNDPNNLEVFFTHAFEQEDGLYSVKQLSKDEVDEIYGGGIDLFFNFEYYV
jgi:AAA15 family ATPase/GTPase